MQPTLKKNTALIGIISIVILAALIVGTIALKPKSNSSSTASDTSSSNTSSADSPTTASTDSASTSYKDDTYQASGSYSSPGGNESIAVTITIASGQVTDSSVTPQAATRESSEYQNDFVDGYKTQVVGKALASLQLSKISGSSLTSRGFNNALEQIRNQARI